MDVLPPRWVDVQEEVTELLVDIAQKSAQLDKLHHKHLLPGFGDEDVRKQDERVIERYTQDITRDFHECQKLVKRIELMVYEAKQQGGVSSGDETMAKNIQISLASRVQDASARFRKKQSTYLRSEVTGVSMLMLGQLANLHCNRITRTRRLRVTVRSLPYPRPKPIHRSVTHGVRCGQILFANHPITDHTADDWPE
jgi:hypothetical protein